MEERARLFPLGDKSGIHHGSEEPTIELGELTHWDLLAAFSRLMRETLANRSLKIQRDDRPLRWYVERLVGWIGGRREVTLRQLLLESADGEGISKTTLIGSFCALLELVKLGIVGAVQATPASEITIVLREDLEGDLEDIVRSTEFDDEADAGTGLELTPHAPAAPVQESAGLDDSADDETDARPSNGHRAASPGNGAAEGAMTSSFETDEERR
jgi:hypothetical protein